jgi:hypothetical protein
MQIPVAAFDWPRAEQSFDPSMSAQRSTLFPCTLGFSIRAGLL